MQRPSFRVHFCFPLHAFVPLKYLPLLNHNATFYQRQLRICCRQTKLFILKSESYGILSSEMFRTSPFEISRYQLNLTMDHNGVPAQNRALHLKPPSNHIWHCHNHHHYHVNSVGNWLCTKSDQIYNNQAFLCNFIHLHANNQAVWAILYTYMRTAATGCTREQEIQTNSFGELEKRNSLLMM